MEIDPLGQLLDLEEDFYNEGYEAGVADSVYAGTIEGKVFGIEKGYDKALELARLRGWAIIWKARLGAATPSTSPDQTLGRTITNLGNIGDPVTALSATNRLQKHIENLLALTDGDAISPENTDDAVTDIDDRTSKATAKARIIANVAGDITSPIHAAGAGIEDATGLKARH